MSDNTEDFKNFTFTPTTRGFYQINYGIGPIESWKSETVMADSDEEAQAIAHKKLQELADETFNK